MRDKRNMRDIKLLVTEPDGRKVWRTFRGESLVGAEMFPIMVFAEMQSQGCWSVFQSESGKLVVYHCKNLAEEEAGTLRVLASFEELQAVVPAEILAEAELAAGIRQTPVYPELPLDV